MSRSDNIYCEDVYSENTYDYLHFIPKIHREINLLDANKFIEI